MDVVTDSYFQAGGFMVARLQATVDIPAKNIRECMSLDWALMNALSPSISVVFFDDIVDSRPSGNTGNGKVQASDQIWLVLISVRNVSDAGVAAQADAGRMVTKTKMALQGYETPGLNPLHQVRSFYRKSEIRRDEKAGIKDGFIHYPLMFSTKTIVRAAPN